MKTKLMLDSGAYTAWRKGTVIDIDEYGQFVTEHKDLFDVCVNLDVIGSGKKSYINWRHLWDNGVETMPVWHVGTDEKWLKKYLDKTDYIGLGAIANLSSVRRVAGLTHIWDNYLREEEKIAKYKVHGMGLTAVDIVTRYPWYSIDSVSPVLQAGYGGIYVPRVEGDSFNFLKLDMYKTSGKSTKHIKGIGGSFFTLPVHLQEVYLEYFAKEGFPMGQLNPVEKKHKGWFDQEQEEVVEYSLVNSYEARLHWNLMIWDRFNKQVPGWDGKDYVHLYVGSASHFKHLLRTNRENKADLGQLFSYVELGNEDRVNSKILKPLEDEKG